MGDAPTNKTAEWIHNAVKKNPCILLPDGNIRTCPVRLSFPQQVFKPEKFDPEDPGSKAKYTCTFLFPASADLTLLRQQLAIAGQDEWGDKFEDYLQADGFAKPLQDQGRKKQYEGYVPGSFFLTASGERKPIVQDANGALIPGDESKVQAGYWAFAILNVYAFNYRKSANGPVIKRGLGFGLGAIRMIAEDVVFGGGFVDAEKAFAGIDIDADVNPTGLFSGSTGGAKSAADLL